MNATHESFDFDQVDFVTSDHHFGHARINELAGRPFATVEDMDAVLVARWNEVVPPGAVVLHLGDVALGPIEQSLALTAQLNGHRLLVPGNHDRVATATQSGRAIARFAPTYEAAGWTILPEIVEGRRRGRRLAASHYPYRGDSHDVDRLAKHRRVDDGTPLLHGHTHSRTRGPDGNQFHVGVDAFDFYPIAFDAIDRWLEDSGEELSSLLIPEEVATLLGRLFPSSVWKPWLHGHNAHLEGARPIDAISAGRVTEVVDALNVEIQAGRS